MRSNRLVRNGSVLAVVLLSHLNNDDPRLWPYVLTGELHIEWTNCDHESIVREPDVQHVVTLIEAQRTPTPDYASTLPSSRTSPITP
ncbi:hypothetical protein BH11ACT6_BH11ACT6_42180 [soil metagenome]